MKKLSLALLLVWTIVFPIHAQSDVSKSVWKSNTVIIDGDTKEWNKPLNFYEDKTGLNYAIANDNKNLYFVFTSPDGMKMRRIMSAGWRIELISKEKKNKFKTSLTFPATRMNWMEDRMANNNPMARKVVANPFVSDYKSQITSIEARGFKSDLRELNLNGSNGIRITIGADSLQHIVYEMAIALNELSGDRNISQDDVIILNISVNAMERPNLGGGYGGANSEIEGNRAQGAIAGAGRSGGGRSGMGGGRSGGRMSHGGSHGAGGSGERSGLFEKASFKQKFRLAGS
ncbi:MAG: hypothetical protein WCJ95_14015 [Mariniphaga sp.]